MRLSRYHSIGALLSALTASLLLSAPVRAERVRRLAVVVGVNDGGAGRTELRHARRDAESIAQVLGRFGGLGTDDLMLLRGASRASIEAALAGLRSKIVGARARGERVEVFFYYSGHSDETGLLLGGDRLDYARLRRAIERLPADVRVAVLDSCASGVMTRGKGGFRGPPFMVDIATNVRGHAYVASASATEVAQESDRLRGSFFTHHLVAGLRGAADANRDRRVTLDEAYQYAFNATLSQTESTRSGPQHPNYDMRLSGSGGLVLTDLRGTNALLVVPRDVEGKLYVRDDHGNLIAEVHKRRKRALSLGLEPGSYRVRISTGKRMLVGSFTVTSEAPTIVRQQALQDSVPLSTSGKGASSPPFQARQLLSLSYVGLAGHITSASSGDPSYAQEYPVRHFADLTQQAAHGAELRYLHRVGPLYLGATAGFRLSQHRYDESDALVLKSLPTTLQESGDATDVYGLLSVQWHVPLWRWIPSVLWRWVHPVLGSDAGAGYLRQTKKSALLRVGETRGPDGPSIDDLVSSSWSRSLPAFYARGRLGLVFTVTRRAHFEVSGVAGLEVSRRLIDDAAQRTDAVDGAGLLQPNLGLTAGLTVSL